MRSLQKIILLVSLALLAVWSLAALALAQNPECPNPYTVGPGDSWSVIASRCDVTLAELRAANPRLWRANGVLYRGEQLTIPGQPEESVVPVPAADEEERVPYTHRVAAGESWRGIANRYQISFADLRAANSDLLSRRGENLRPADELVIPGLFVGTPTPTPSKTPTASNTCQNSALWVGGLAVVNPTPPNPNSVRTRPSRQAEVIGKLQPGEAMDVLEGPICVRGRVWWRVQALGQPLTGWTAEGDGAERWLLPYTEVGGSDDPHMPSFGAIDVCLPDDFQYDPKTEEGYCQTSSSVFYGDVQKLYLSWSYAYTPEGTQLTRRFYRNGVFLWEITNSAGEATKRWSLSRPQGYVWVLIDAQFGKLWELFHSDYLPAGEYQMELYVNDNYFTATYFTIE
ncbi:MAG: LysM peptidoglycan-binding domain-containing protein [Chloroflexi bacterium]|nr:MAG: LysM peptidoglycan-binding domain-containing protein [Chloroflexota bacterium]